MDLFVLLQTNHSHLGGARVEDKQSRIPAELDGYFLRSRLGLEFRVLWETLSNKARVQ